MEIRFFLYYRQVNILAGVMGREMLQGTGVKRRLLGMKHLHVTGMQKPIDK